MEKAFQDYFPGNDCFGCGPSNEHGLHVESFWLDKEKTETVCLWKPMYYHSSGLRNVLHGGTAGDLIDCHGIWTAMAHHYNILNREIGSGPVIWYVTRYCETDFVKRTPMDGVILLRGKVEDFSESKCIVRVRVWAGGEERASGKVVGVRIELTPEEILKLKRPLANLS